MKMKIVTPYGDCFSVDENGNFIESRNGEHDPNGHWKMQGLERIGPFNTLRFIPFKRVWDMVREGKVEWLFKNGKPRFTIRDLDHGTTRVWGNWNYHGVRRVWIE